MKNLILLLILFNLFSCVKKEEEIIKPEICKTCTTTYYYNSFKANTKQTIIKSEKICGERNIKISENYSGYVINNPLGLWETVEYYTTCK